MALQIGDFRVGNLINYGGSEVGVSDIDILAGSIGVVTPEANYYEIVPANCEPIALTEKHLIECGFIFKSMGTCGAMVTRHSGHWFKNGKAVFAGIKGKYFDCFLQAYEEIDIKYVHQLQNIYHALTGQELTL